ncbi:MAG: gamma-glutamyltransferase, partial [Candidatus Bathyarchaeia archaeon]
QLHVQLISNIIDFGKGIKESLEAPRWRIIPQNNTILIEKHMPNKTIKKLKEKSHKVQPIESWNEVMGHAHKIIINNERKLLYAASDPRSDGLAIAY